MAYQNFIVAFGGSGVRTLISLLHLCASGYITESRLDILLIDTDFENGNTAELKKIHENYNRIKTLLDAQSNNNSRRFFKSTIKIDFCNDFTKDVNEFDVLINDGGSDEQKVLAGYLAEILYGKKNLKKNYDKGFFGIASAGAAVFHYALRKTENKMVTEFTKNILTKVQGCLPDKKVRLIFINSIFGGTGAASLAPYLDYMNKCLKDIIPTNDIEKTIRDLDTAAIILTPYMTFRSEQGDTQPELNQNDFKNKSYHIAKYFEENVKKDHIRIKNTFLINCPNKLIQERGKEAYEGEEQKNWPHFVELLAAETLKDFFGTERLPEGDFIFEGDSFYSKVPNPQNKEQNDTDGVLEEEVNWDIFGENNIYIKERLYMLVNMTATFNNLFYEELFPHNTSRKLSPYKASIYWYQTTLCGFRIKEDFEMIQSYCDSFLQWCSKININFEDYEVGNQLVEPNKDIKLFHEVFFINQFELICKQNVKEETYAKLLGNLRTLERLKKLNIAWKGHRIKSKQSYDPEDTDKRLGIFLGICFKVAVSEKLFVESDFANN